MTLIQNVSIIIPAYNEAAVISRCLKNFLDNNFLDNNQVIVVCNGCTDNTAKIVSELSEKFICIETDIPSKTNALNMGDKVAKFYPRIYLDADISISIAAINAMTNTLNKEGVFATSLESKFIFSNTSWMVKAYYDVWLQLPYYKEGMIGSGVYALSEEGRKRFNTFPQIISDDGFVRCLFTHQERPLTSGYYAEINASKDILSLIKIKTRSRLGRYELQAKFPHLISNEKKDYANAFKNMFLNHKLLVKSIVYIYINLIARIRANYQYANKNLTLWERDESNRN